MFGDTDIEPGTFSISTNDEDGTVIDADPDQVGYYQISVKGGLVSGNRTTAVTFSVLPGGEAVTLDIDQNGKVLDIATKDRLSRSAGSELGGNSVFGSVSERINSFVSGRLNSSRYDNAGCP